MQDNEDAVDRAARLLCNASSVSVFTGAGISVDSGIPDFRSPGGLWSKYDPVAMAAMAAVSLHLRCEPAFGSVTSLAPVGLNRARWQFEYCDYETFRRRPHLFWTMAREIVLTIHEGQVA
jgi:NAD-dependent SIR2 family protein deacetylase